MKTIQKLIGIAIFLIAVTPSQKALANASQPGVWNAGGTVFTMLYPEDSLTFKKVQMQQERIYIQLYKGYVVVKGVYLFRNTTNEKLNFKMGYPVNGIYSGGDIDLNQITLDSLSRFKIKTKNEWLPLLEQQNGDYGKISSFSDNWKVWNMMFAPNESQMVEVYFIVNTNEAKVTRGYESERRNAFVYLLESGSVWKNPIEKGSFYVQLMDGLTAENVQGISQGFGFRYNETNKVYFGTKTNLSPTPKDNLVVTYYKLNENFSFKIVISKSDSLFAEMDKWSSFPLESLAYTEIETGNPYKVKRTFLGSFPELIKLFVMVAPFIVVLLFLTIFIWALIKWVKIKKNKGV